jgi:hypothetical protein
MCMQVDVLLRRAISLARTSGGVAQAVAIGSAFARAHARTAIAARHSTALTDRTAAKGSGAPIRIAAGPTIPDNGHNSILPAAAL